MEVDEVRVGHGRSVPPPASAAQELSGEAREGFTAAFLLCASDDEYGRDEATLDIFTMLRAAGVSAEMHMLARGKHALNMGDRSEYLAVRNWPDRMAEWMRDGGRMAKQGAT